LDSAKVLTYQAGEATTREAGANKR
jgi:hypothetical protein